MKFYNTLFKSLGLFIFVVNFGMTHVNAQKIELIAAAGTSHFLGDLGGKPGLGTNDISDLDFATTRYAIMGGARLFLGKKIALRANAAYTRIAGDDKYTINIERRGRNLNFFSPVFTGAAMLEYHMTKKTKGARGGLYMFAGIESVYFEPKTTYNGKTVNLRPVGTEGQRFMPGRSIYSNNVTTIPFGLGYRIPVGRGLLGIELNTRKSFTDYMDDVSTTFVDRNQLYASSGIMAVELSDRSISTIPGFSSPGAIRGDPKDMDTFFFILVMYHYPLGKSGYQGSAKNKGTSYRFKKGKCFEF